MSIRFKVTIPKGSLLEAELSNKDGKARNNRLYFLAELGAQQVQNNNTPAMSQVGQSDVKESDTATPTREEDVIFPMTDLMQL